MSLDRQRYNALQILLHWSTLVLLAVACISMELSELYSKGSPERLGLRQWHYTSGLLVWLLLWPRLLMASLLESPPVKPRMTDWMSLAARAMHGLLYFFMLLMPFVGWMTLSAKGTTVQWGAIVLPTLIEPNRSLAHWLKEAHEAGAAIGYFLVGLHAAAALFHHLVMKDNTLARMLPMRFRKTAEIV